MLYSERVGSYGLFRGGCKGVPEALRGCVKNYSFPRVGSLLRFEGDMSRTFVRKTRPPGSRIILKQRSLAFFAQKS